MICLCSLGVVIERVAYKSRFVNSTRVAALITAIGESYLLENTAVGPWAESRPFIPDFGTETITYLKCFSQRALNFWFSGYRCLNGVITILSFVIQKWGRRKLCVRLPWMSKAAHTRVDVDGWFPLHLPRFSACRDCRCLVGVVLQYDFSNNGITVGLKAALHRPYLVVSEAFPGAMVGGLSHRSTRSNGKLLQFTHHAWRVFCIHWRIVLPASCLVKMSERSVGEEDAKIS